MMESVSRPARPERVLQRRYRVVRSLGRGGLGAVYLCDDLRLPSKQWALKQMHNPQPALYDKFRETFEREAAFLASLRHPSLPLIVDFFEEDDAAYLVMEYVQGENLALHIRRQGPLSEAVAFHYGLQIADVLSFLHGRKPPLIFRDLKPENVMLTPESTIKLIDFGLARRFVPGKRSDTLPSGSVGYAAPEQWEDLSQTDARSDIYSWGATIAHLVSGKIPSPVFPLSSLRGMEPPISEAGRAILARCVKARPAERYADAALLAREVRRHLDGQIEAEEVERPDHGESLTETDRFDPLVERQHPRSMIADPRSRTPESRTPIADFPSPIADPRPPISDLQSPPPDFRAPISDLRPLTSDPRLPIPEYRRRATDRAEYDATPWRRESFRTAVVPFVLLLLATLAFVNAIAVTLPRHQARSVGSASPPPIPPGQADNAGVGPYQMRTVTGRQAEVGRKLYEAGRLEEAIEALEREIMVAPYDAEAHILRQNAYILETHAPCIRIPFISSLSGVDGSDAYAELYGAALAQTEINHKGGVGGRKILIDVYDDRSSMTQCLQIMERLLNDKNTLFVVGPYSSQNTLAVAPLFNNARVDLIAPVASAQGVWHAGRYVLVGGESTDHRVRAMARYIVRSGARRVAIMADVSRYLSVDMLTSFQDEVRSTGVQVLNLPPFDENASAFPAQADAILQLHPDAVFIAEYHPQTVARIVGDLRARGVTTPIGSQAIPFMRELVEADADRMNGHLLAGYFHPDMRTAAARTFMSSFRATFGDVTPTHVTVTTYDVMNAVFQALHACSKDGRLPSRQALHAYLRSQVFKGVAGRFALGRRLDARPLWLMEVRNGRFRLLDTDRGEAPRPDASPRPRAETPRGPLPTPE